MAVKPPNPVSIPFDGTITMLSTDKLILTFSEAGLFCSEDSNDFKPHLPHGVTFAAGDIWPDPSKYPHGASPAGDGDSTYKYKTSAGADCHHDDESVPRAIQVGSGANLMDEVEEASVNSRSVPRPIGVGNIDQSTTIKS
jgi:hypothetical protein